jgi:hypothetical protein
MGIWVWGGRDWRTELFNSYPISAFHQVFLIIHHAPLVNSLAEVILNGDLSETYTKPAQDVPRSSVSHSRTVYILIRSSICFANSYFSEVRKRKQTKNYNIFIIH